MHARGLVRTAFFLASGALASCSFNAGFADRTAAVHSVYAPTSPVTYALDSPVGPLEPSYPPPGYATGGGPTLIEHRERRDQGTHGRAREQELLREHDDHVVHGDHSHDRDVP